MSKIHQTLSIIIALMFHNVRYYDVDLLRPYSPDLSPIELALAKFKALVRRRGTAQARRA